MFSGSYYLLFHNNKHGIAVFWKIHVCRIADIRPIEFNRPWNKINHFHTQRACAFEFVSVDDLGVSHSFTVIGAHLKSKPEHEDIRLEQVGHIIDHARDSKHMVILAGDLNTFPDGAVCRYLKGCGYTDRHRSDKGLYCIPFTTCKVRGDKTFRHVSVYLFHNKYAKLPWEATVHESGKHTRYDLTDEEEKNGFPSAENPSDHFMVLSTYVLGTSSEDPARDSYKWLVKVFFVCLISILFIKY